MPTILDFFQRLIRSRRKDTEGWEFQKRGPVSQEDLSHVSLSEISGSEKIQEISNAVENWRFSALESGEINDAILKRFRYLINKVSSFEDIDSIMENNFDPIFEGEKDILLGISDLIKSIELTKFIF